VGRGRPQLAHRCWKGGNEKSVWAIGGGKHSGFRTDQAEEVTGERRDRGKGEEDGEFQMWIGQGCKKRGEG